MNGYGMGLGMGFCWLWMIVILVLTGLAMAVLVKCLRRWTKGKPMGFTINRLFTDEGIDFVDARTRAALAESSFGVLTEIDVTATMKKTLDEVSSAYRPLGACSPKMALEAIGMEPSVRAMLPFNVILREAVGGVEVSAIDPVASMQAIDNSALHSVTGQARDLLAKVVAEIESGPQRNPPLTFQHMEGAP